jgi:TPR repeat protein
MTFSTARRPKLMRVLVLCALPFTAWIPTVRAADDTARFSGSWTASFPANGQTVTILSVHDTAGYRNFVVAPTGNVPAGSGSFSAANGKYATSADAPNDAGSYRFLDNDTVACTNAAGQMLTWKRYKASGGTLASALPAQSGNSTAISQPAPETPNARAPAYDPSLPPATNAAIAAFNRKDYQSAWSNFMVAAEAGDSEAQAGVGAMLFEHLNPPGSGYYAQCEKWLLASANQGNTKGMVFLARFYYARATAVVGPLNPDTSMSRRDAPMSQRTNVINPESTALFAKARDWFERASAKGDIYAMGNLATMLDAGIGGPKDGARAAQLRTRVKAGPDADFAQRASTDTERSAIIGLWQAGHYTDAVQAATGPAQHGDARAQALLAQAYYEGTGADRNYATAFAWAQKSAAQNDRDGLYYLGMAYYEALGAPRNLTLARQNLARSAKLGKTVAMQKLSDIYYLTCRPVPSYAPNGDYLLSQCPSVDLLSDQW